VSIFWMVRAVSGECHKFMVHFCSLDFQMVRRYGNQDIIVDCLPWILGRKKACSVLRMPLSETFDCCEVM
jgi:hypothetical protein